MAYTPISNIGTIATIIAGGRVFTDLTSIIRLFGYVGSGGTATNCSLRIKNGSAGYTVTALKKLNIAALIVNNFDAQVGAFRTLQSDNDLGVASNTAPTSPVYPGGSSTVCLNFTPPTSGQKIEFPYDFDVAAGKYFSVQRTAGVVEMAFIAYGYETTA